MSLTQRYELNNPPIIAEVIEGEVIAIDLDRGSYYSLLGPAAQIWNALLAGRNGQEILASVAPAPMSGSLDADLIGFLDALLAERLIRPAAGPCSGMATLAPLAPWPGASLRFERFTDMQDLLVLDPIHEVDEEAGWPKPTN
jgi:hypothetical protein